MILETRISSFKSTRDTETIKGEYNTIGLNLQHIKNGLWSDQIEKLRGGDESIKRNLPTIAFHGIFDGWRKKESFIEASGLIILDIDDVSIDEIEEVKQEIMDESQHVLAAMVSPSGNGIKVLYYVNPYLVNADNYRQIGKQVVSDFEIYGDVDYLSVTDCLIATYDPNILINEEAFPALIMIKDTVIAKTELEPLDETKDLWEDAEDFFDTVFANDIANKTNNNFHYIQVAVLDMAKYGFRHPEEDLSFIIDYAESVFKRSSDNKERFIGVTELAKNYPQTKWPYKFSKQLGEDDEEDDGFVDYSEYIKEETEEENSEETDDGYGLIKYATFYDEVLERVKEGDRVGFEISLKEFSDIFRFKGTGILTVTGIPGHGKTEFVDACVLDLARLYGHESIVVGFEQTPAEHIIKLSKKLVGTNITCPSWFGQDKNIPIFKKAYDFLTNKIKHIDTKKSGGNINTILEVAASRIKESRDEGGDPKYLVLDPFNMLSIKGKFSGHEKIEEILRRLTHFSHQMEVMIILVAHPFKMTVDEKTGEYRVPDFYSVKGSSAFFEMSYHGLTVYRSGYDTNVFVKVLKVKQNNLGTAGETAFFDYDRNNGRYIPVSEEGNELSGDHRKKDWLENAIYDTKKI